MLLAGLIVISLMFMQFKGDTIKRKKLAKPTTLIILEPCYVYAALPVYLLKTGTKASIEIRQDIANNQNTKT